MATNNAINNDPAIGVTIPLDVPSGGTGAATLTAKSLILGKGTSAVAALGTATNGQIPIGSTGADPVLATITAGTGISVSNGAGSISLTLSSTAGKRVLLSTQNASNSTSIDFTSLFGNYPYVIVELIEVIPVNDNVTFNCRFKSGASIRTASFFYNSSFEDSNATITNNASGGGGGVAQAVISGINLSNSSNSSYNAIFYFFNTSGSSVSNKCSLYQSVDYNTSGYTEGSAINGSNKPGKGNISLGGFNTYDGASFYMSSGNISSGLFRAWGVL